MKVGREGRVGRDERDGKNMLDLSCSVKYCGSGGEGVVGKWLAAAAGDKKIGARVAGRIPEVSCRQVFLGSF